jgi:hypothetical protein
MWNERGKVVVPVYVTERCMPGVLVLHEGAWMDLDENGVDRSGNPDFLTLDEPSPAGAFTYNNAMVNIKKSDLEHRPGWDQLATSRAMCSVAISEGGNPQWLSKKKMSADQGRGERRKKEVYTPVVPEMQLGFVHNNVDCIGCRACEIACKDKNGLAPGPRFRRVQYVEGGTFRTSSPTR